MGTQGLSSASFSLRFPHVDSFTLAVEMMPSVDIEKEQVSPSAPISDLEMQRDKQQNEKREHEGSDVTAADEPTPSPEPVPEPPKYQVTFPEGGLDAWLVVLGSSLAQFCTFGYANAFGVFQDYYTREYMTNYSTSEIGWIGGIQFCLIFSSAIVTGRLFDRGYFRYMLCAGAFINALCIFMLSLTHKNQYYQVFLSQGVGVGLSCGLTYVPTLSVVSHYFQRRRALAMGCVSAGSALGAVLHPIILNKLFNNPSIGFHNGVRIDGGINTFLFLISVCLTKTRLPPKKNLKPIPFVRFLKEPAYALVCLGTALCFFGLFYPIFYLQLNAVSHGVDESLAFYALSVLNAASLFGRVTPMFYTHRLGVFNLLAFFNIALGVVACTMSVVHNLAGTMIFAVFYGFTNGGAITVTAPALALLAHDQSEIGVRMGICFFFSGIIALFAEPLAGALLGDNYDQWLRASLFAGLMMAVGAGACMTGARTIVAHKRGKHIV